LVTVLSTLRAARHHTRPYFLYAGSAVAVALLTIFVAVPQFFAWRSDVLVEESLATLVADYPLTDRDIPRPSGSFQYQPFGNTRRIEQNERDKTVANLQRALEWNEKNAKASEYLGTYYLLAKRDFDSAQVAFAKAYVLDSTNAAILNDMGVLAWHQENFEEARQKFSLAVREDPTFAEAQYNLAILLQQMGQKQLAIQAWERYLQLDPQSTWAMIAKEHLGRLRQQE
jgi:tetratricopeptide (TPR) repeat protein